MRIALVTEEFLPSDVPSARVTRDAAAVSRSAPRSAS